MKTPLQKEYINKLTNLNDQLCFYLFNQEELNQKLENFSDSANELYTTDLFNQNKYSSKIHVTFEKLPDFQDQNRTLNFGAYFSFSYEFLSSYIDDVISLIEHLNGVNLSNSQKRKEPEKQLKLIINACSNNLPDAELFDTIKYCRLRRNYFTHILETLNNKFQDLVTNKGVHLNNFWTSARQELDFTQTNVDEFKEIETIDLIKIIRIVLQEMDSFLASLLNKRSIAEYVTKELYEQSPTRINADVIRTRKSKVKKLAKQQFDINLTNQEMDDAVQTVGVR